MPDEPDDLGLPLNANGPAYTSSQARHGVPLDYVGEKLGTAIEDLHRYGRQHPTARDELMPAMYHLLVAYLGLHNMLGAANDHQLAPRLFARSTTELDAWLGLVSRQGDVLGFADADGNTER
jgi:hypothetical protein